MLGKRQWKDLFQKHTFFTDGYKYYLSIISGSRTKEAQQIWSGLVQSKVRRLVTSIEASQESVALAHPFNKGFERVHRCRDDEEIQKVLEGSLEYQDTDVKTETTEEANDVKQHAAAEGSADKMEMPNANGEPQQNGDGMHMIYTTTFYVGMEIAKGKRFGQPPTLTRADTWKGAKSLDITWPIAEFRRLCTEWPQYNEDLNSIRVVHTRRSVNAFHAKAERCMSLTCLSWQLPADVFEPGEVRPTQTEKKKGKTKSAQAASRKRTIAEAELDVGDGSSKKMATS